MKIAFYTLGCKTNQYETQAMERLLTQMGHSIVSFDDDADCYCINTCSVTAVADKKNRAVIRRCRKTHPNALLAVCGCYPQHAEKALEGLGVDIIGGSSRREEFLQQVISCVHTRENGRVLDNDYICAPVTIGKNVWIGAGTIILKGSAIEDNCIIAAGSVVKGIIPEGSVFMQKRERNIYWEGKPL